MANWWRGTSVAVALAVAAWFALGIRQANDTAHATALITGGSHLNADQARHARALLHSAATLNPDRMIDILRGQLALERGQNATGQRILLAVTRSEPQNLEAWVQLAYAAARNHDDRLLVLSGRRILRLFPKPR